ncbi:MAG: beta-lactamase family protein [Deltaproteobacteria bacterium]|nr:beta-lactamase family protein [Deltaproteobacteria bacterium]
MAFYQLDPEVTPQAVGMDNATVNKIAAMFRTEVESGKLFWGAQLAIYRRGKKVLDIGGGLARASDQKPVTPETMFVLYSSTKGLAALAMHLLRDRGRFQYDDLVSRYWPEFTRNGKEHATITHVLGHRVGNTVGPDWLTHKLWGDRQKCAQAMEELTPRWTPGEANGYHPLNYGFMINELLLRIDGRDCGRLLKDEIFAPLGLNSVFVGLPESEEARVACVYEAPSDRDSISQMATLMGFTPDEEYFAFQRSLNFDEKVAAASLPFPEAANIFNRPEVHRAVIAGGGGIACARDMAKIYAMLAQEAQWKGKRYLSTETLQRSILPTNEPGAIDRSLRIPIIYGLGWMLGHLARGASLRTFGHPGKGGQTCLADLDRELSFSFLNTGQKDYVEFAKFSTELVSLAFDACR